MEIYEKVVCKFKFECPNDWEKLDYTKDQNIKYCSNCEQKVYWAKDINEFYSHAALKRCVAIDVYKDTDKGQDVITLMGDPILEKDYGIAYEDES